MSEHDRIPDRIFSAGRRFFLHNDGIVYLLLQGACVCLVLLMHDIGRPGFSRIRKLCFARIYPHRRKHSGIAAGNQRTFTVNETEIADVGDATRRIAAGTHEPERIPGILFHRGPPGSPGFRINRRSEAFSRIIIIPPGEEAVLSRVRSFENLCVGE